VHIESFRIENFRRLKDVIVRLDRDTSIFVGANNSGKTSATHVFNLFLGKAKGDFQIYDFSADCWANFESFDPDMNDPHTELPRIILDLWLSVDDANIHRVVDLLPNLQWTGGLVGVRLTYGPRNGEMLLSNFAEARRNATLPQEQEAATYKPWPQNLTDYLTRRLKSEYEIRYSVLDAAQFTDDLKPKADYEPYPLGTTDSGAAKIVESLIRVDFLNAQRYLSDGEPRGRGEELSKRLARFYTRSLDKREADIEALSAVTESEERLNAHFADVFGPTLDRLTELGYPGMSNPSLVVKASFNAESILNGSARVCYTLPVGGHGAAAAAVMLPDQYNGLGFKNLIYMVVEVLDFHYSWIDGEGDRPPIHMVMIEEPESHLHVQLQQVFIRKIREILPTLPAGFETQMVVTTHSSHIIYEKTFEPIRYFKRADKDENPIYSDVRNLSTFYSAEESETRDFLLRYLKLTHCDLFFADAAILVEGNVERLLLPLILQKSAPGLQSCHLTILEVGGAFAHKFKKLVEFLGLTTLVITDLDSVANAEAGGTDHEDEGAKRSDSGKLPTCMTGTQGAVTSNETLKQWLPKLDSIADLLALDESDKCLPGPDGNLGSVRVAYQTEQAVTWRGTSANVAGRTLEEAFALQNLEWCQHPDQEHLGLQIKDRDALNVGELHRRIYERVRGFEKTTFALEVISNDINSWTAPKYISDGLTWLCTELQVAPASVTPAAAPEPEVQE
jgi:predicted ATP-dependent endonuclease of OLD family